MPFRNGVWTRGSSNAYDVSRGNVYQRRRRKLWLIEEYGWPDPVDPLRGLVCCWKCGVPMTFEDITVDRFPVPGCDGGRYERGNIRPACRHCNEEHGCTLRRTVPASDPQTRVAVPAGRV